MTNEEIEKRLREITEAEGSPLLSAMPMAAMMGMSSEGHPARANTCWSCEMFIA
jgi:hypothetical protein